MENTVIDRIQESLVNKRKNLIHWLEAAPEPEKESCLCCEEASAQVLEPHLHVIDTSLEKAASQTLGICEVCHEKVDSILLEIDYTACICLGHYSDDERRQLESDLEMSQALQRALLPSEMPVIPGVDLAGFSRPAKIVGGDYFDFIKFRDGAHGMVIADVEGHGISSSMLMSSLQTALHTLVPDNDSPVPVLERINRFYIHNINLTTFVTVFLSRFDPATRQLTYASAGHNPPLLLHVNGGSSFSWLKPTAAAIGLMEEYHVRAESLTLAPGDILLFYTDGVTEATNVLDEQFGLDRLAATVRDNAGLSSQEMIRAIRQSLLEFCGEKSLEDDVTLMVCKIA